MPLSTLSANTPAPIMLATTVFIRFLRYDRIVRRALHPDCTTKDSGQTRESVPTPVTSVSTQAYEPVAAALGIAGGVPRWQHPTVSLKYNFSCCDDPSRSRHYRSGLLGWPPGPYASREV